MKGKIILFDHKILISKWKRNKIKIINENEFNVKVNKSF